MTRISVNRDFRCRLKTSPEGNFEEQEDEVKTKVTITRRDGEELLESGRVVIEYPLGEFSEHKGKLRH